MINFDHAATGLLTIVAPGEPPEETLEGVVVEEPYTLLLLASAPLRLSVTLCLALIVRLCLVVSVH